ncbi:hypothetical protein AWB78_05119 [Caballeronia calidae]|uniref:Uncharacterized protein n=1 Tax=Caballeronia calidae TaxID=1777139 RepID=A0A158DFH2_9BURK|nr:hypothetical protein AWB78_05119 [Caballeronia calidae]
MTTLSTRRRLHRANAFWARVSFVIDLIAGRGRT